MLTNSLTMKIQLHDKLQITGGPWFSGPKEISIIRELFLDLSILIIEDPLYLFETNIIQIKVWSGLGLILTQKMANWQAITYPTHTKSGPFPIEDPSLKIQIEDHFLFSKKWVLGVLY